MKNGKGDKVRPLSIPKDLYDREYERIFGKKPLNNIEDNSESRVNRLKKENN